MIRCLHRLLGGLLLSMLLSGCTSTAPDTRTTRAPGVDFSAYETFSVAGQGMLAPDDRKLLESWIAASLRDAGLVPSEDPDLEVRYLAFARDETSVEAVPREELLRVREGYVTWNEYETDYRIVTEGTLVVDVVDRARDALVWEGRVTQAIERGARIANRKRIRSAVEALLAEFPRR
ncbi:MAG: DUF4136 domain-containing protein [Pseudomonadales bacterium]|jgi:hypothetical protein|nr:DUF4136 domain-containing protein [Pseudomonadales bacterium]